MEKLLMCICIIVCGVSVFLWSYLYAFKQRYKRYYARLEDSIQLYKQNGWNLSRQTNHDKEKKQLKISSIFLLIAFIGIIKIITDDSCKLPVALCSTFCSMFIMFFLGKIYGRTKCDKKVHALCKKFKISE